MTIGYTPTGLAAVATVDSVGEPVRTPPFSLFTKPEVV